MRVNNDLAIGRYPPDCVVRQHLITRSEVKSGNPVAQCDEGLSILIVNGNQSRVESLLTLAYVLMGTPVIVLVVSLDLRKEYPDASSKITQMLKPQEDDVIIWGHRPFREGRTWYSCSYMDSIIS